MRMFHATLATNLPSIKKEGLCTSYCHGKVPAVWLCLERRIPWAFLHTIRRHGGKVEDVVVLEVEVDSKAMKRSGVKDLFYSLDDIEPSHFVSILDFALVSRSPLEVKKNGS